MNTGPTTVTTMLAVVAGMLGLNLIVRGSPTAVAVPPVPEPTVVAGATLFIDASAVFVTRFWSDGRVDLSRIREVNELCNFQTVCGPPFVVIP